MKPRLPALAKGPEKPYQRRLPASYPAGSERGRSSGVEHDLAKVGVEGSNPFARSNFFTETKRLEGTGRVHSAYTGRLATQCKRFVSSRIWSVPSALRRRM